MTSATGFRAAPREKFRLCRLLATTALGACLVTPAFATNYLVGTEQELRSALASYANGDSITLSNDITLTAGGGGNLPEVHSDVTISGGGHTLSGGGAYRGLFVTSGTVRVEDLKITDTLAQGGASAGGGAGAGLGGALFVNEGATVTVSNVDLSGNEAKGGAASANTSFNSGSGGAGMVGDGGNASASQGGVGGSPDGGMGGTTPATVSITNDGSIAVTAQDGPAGSTGGTGGGGGGGAAGQHLYVTATSGDATVNGGEGGAGGIGGFGGGGGQGGSGSWNTATAHDPGTASASGSNGGEGGAGGFGAGGGAGGGGGLMSTIQFDTDTTFHTQNTSGNGGNGGQAGFGGSGGLGGAGSSAAPGGLGGVALGDGSGAGMGGALFVRQGGQLIVKGNLALNGNSVAAGGAGSRAFGSGIFLHGSGNLSFMPGAGETQTISDTIDDMVGVVAQGYVPPAGTYTGNERWGVTVDGEGTLVLSGANSFSGGALVSKGTLSVGADANLGNPHGGIMLETGALATTASFATGRDILLSLGGSLSQATGTIFTVNGIVSGGGSLTKAGTGTLVLTGDNSYGGGTSLEAGTLRLDHDHALGTGLLSASDGTTIQYGLDDLSIANAIAIDGDVKFDYEQPGPAVAMPEQAGAISGAGRLVRTGTGGLILSHTNSYEGGTTVEGGSLIANVTGALGTGGADIKSGAALAFIGSQATSTDAGSRTITVENDGQLQFSDHSNGRTATVLNEAGGLVALKGNAALVEVGSLSGAGDVDLDFGTMIVGGLGSNDTISGAIRDGNVPPILLPAAQAGSLVKTGAGRLTLSGTNSYLGTTTVEEGTLVVNGSIASSSLITVSSGAVLGGGGTVGVTRVEGTIAPGNSIGTLNVKGAFTQVAGSTYAVQLDATSSDRIAVVGAANLQGGTLDVEAAPGGYSLGARYTILTTTDGLTGRYAALTGDAGPLSAFVSVIDSYDTNNAYLDVSKVRDFAAAGLTPNQIAAGEGLDNLTSGVVFNAVANLATDAVARDAFDQLSGEIHASAKGMLLKDSRFVRDAATSRIAAAFGDGSTAALPVMAYGEGGPEMVAADTDRFAVWGQAFGSWGNTDSDGNAAAFDRSTGGLLAGADTLVGGWRVGVLGGYSHSSFDADDRNSSGKSDSYHLGLYGGTNWGAIAFRTGAAYSWNSLSTKRAVAFGGFTDGLSADYDAGTAQIFGELAYKADAGHFKFEPFANLAYVSVHTDGFSETGGAAALTSAGSTTDATFTTLGLRASTDLALDGINATARGMLGWRHAFGDTTPLSAFALAGGDQFTIAGVPIARDAAVIEAGLDLNMSANATLGLSYTGQFGDGSADNGVKVDLNVQF